MFDRVCRILIIIFLLTGITGITYRLGYDKGFKAGQIDEAVSDIVRDIGRDLKSELDGGTSNKSPEILNPDNIKI